MKDIQIPQGISKALLGKEEKPEKIKEEDWEVLNVKATSAIRPNLGDKVINNILDEDSAQAIWKKLESLYMNKNIAKQTMHKETIICLQMKENTNMLEYLNVSTCRLHTC